MKALRWTAGILAAVLSLGVLALFVCTELINPNQYRGEVDRLVTRYTGRPFVIEGTLRLAWFPWLALHVGPARLGNLPGETGPALLSWRSASLRVRLLPLLLHRRMEIGTIRVSGADIHLWRTASGAANWRDLIAHSPASGSSSGTLPVIGGLILRDATLKFREPGTTLRLTHWQLRVGAWQPGRPVSVSTAFVLHTPALPPSGVPIRFTTRGTRFATAPLELSAPRVTLNVANARLAGRIRFTEAAMHPTGEGTLTLEVPSLRALIGELGFTMHLPKNRSVLRTVSASGRWRLADGALRVAPLSARLDATTLTGWIERSGGARPLWTFDLAADHIDLADYLPARRQPVKPLKLPLAALRALHAEGTVTVQRATFNGTTVRGLRLHVQ